MVIQGKAYWAAVKSPNTTFDPDGMWTVDVCNLDEANLNIANKDNLIVKNKGDDRGDFVTIKRKVMRKDGQRNRQPDLMDGQKKILDCMIGNGSTVNVLYSTYDWEYRGRKGTSADLRTVQVLDLVPYKDGNDDELKEIPGTFSSTDAVAEDDINF
tara:strand:- start:110 stop:577 length:468 start_codon:yes stop_codon:yes gene_type:complete